MNKPLRAACGAAVALMIVLMAASSRAQPASAGAQPIPPPAQQAPALPQTQQTPAWPPVQPANSVPRTSPLVQAPSPPASANSPSVPVEPSGAPGEAARPAAGLGHLRELSPWSMFLSADLLVKAVMIGLAFASLVTWTIFIAKTIQLSRARKQVTEALARIAGTRSLSEAQLALGSRTNILSALLAAATQEIRMSADGGGEDGIKERTASHFSEIVRMEARAVRYGMAIVATIGATSPFVGLFGTVWGIMNSFIGISKAQTTNLAVVAPGIAEALLATAIGLAAAIPAVIIYNHFSRATKSYLDLVSRGSGAIGRLLSRDLDRFNGRMVSSAAE